MKRIIAVALAILTLSGMLFAATSCGKNKDKYDFSAEVKDSEVVIFNGKKVFQTEKYPAEKLSGLDIAFAKEHVSFVDVDFDGYKDLCLAVGKDGDSIRYIFWLFDSKTKLFVYSKELSELTTVALNADKKQLISSVIEDGKLYYVTYAFRDGKLTMLSKIASDSPDVPDDVTEAVKNNTIGGKVSEPSLSQAESESEAEVSASETKKADGSNKDTTAPSGSGGKNNTTTPQKEGDVHLATGDINDGWF